MAVKRRDVFVNCPFDREYNPLFRAIVFTIVRSGFRPRCALEADNAAENRFSKICAIIGDCRYGVHDISRTQASGRPRLPRFNMPLELGVFLGAQRLGDQPHRNKRCIIFDTERYRYQRFISDLAGQDIHAHADNVQTLIRELAAWLRDQSGDRKVPGGSAIARDFENFRADLPQICAARQIRDAELTFGDLNAVIVEWLTPNSPSR
jgi:hypothetical protein